MDQRRAVRVLAVAGAVLAYLSGHQVIAQGVALILRRRRRRARHDTT